MKTETVYSLLGELGVDLTRRSISGVWHNFSCPFAPWYHDGGVDRNPSFGVSVYDDGSSKSYYRCLSCQQHGQLTLLPAKLGALRKESPDSIRAAVVAAERLEYTDTPTIREAPGWEDSESDTHETATSGRRVHAYGSALLLPYLRTRGLSFIDAWRLGLRYDDVQKRVLFPVYNNRLQLEGFNGRSILPKRFLSKLNPKSRDYNGLDKRRLFLFNPHYYLNHGKHRLILVEGAFDYAIGQKAGFLGTHATMGTAVTDEKIEILQNLGRPVFLFFDNDKAGIDATYGVYNVSTGLREDRHKSWAHRLYSHVPVWICHYPASAVRDGRTDPGSLTPREFSLAVAAATLFSGADPETAGSVDEIPF